MISLCVFVVSSFFVAQLSLVYVVRLLFQAGILSADDIAKPLFQLLFVVAAYTLALAIIVFIPRLLSFQPNKNLTTELAVAKKPNIRHLGFSVAGYGLYFVLTIAFSFLMQSIWHDFNANQAQQVGFKGLSNGFEYILAFVALVVVAPVLEELLFRGYLFGHLRKNSRFWVSALITSIIFGFVHLQWNVSVDVFALSLVLCYLREKTGAIWAGIALHMIKNAIAFTILFLHPDILKNFSS